MTKILSDERFCPTKNLSDEVLSGKVIILKITEENQAKQPCQYL